MRRPREIELIDEHALAGFREHHLAPANLLALIERFVIVLFKLPVGVGKTFAAQRLLALPELYARFDLVIYAAPAWNIVRDVIAGLDRDPAWPVRRVLEARPGNRCGDLDDRWSDLEVRGCSAVGKAELCGEKCPVAADCSWPRQLEDLTKVQLVIMTDQRIALIRNIVHLIRTRSRRQRALVLLDEASVLDGELEIKLGRIQIGQLTHALRNTRCRHRDWPGVRDQWMGELARLLSVRQADLEGTRWQFPPNLHAFAYQIQCAGLVEYGPDFRYCAYDLSLLSTSRSNERWRDSNGIRFIGRPYLDCHVALLSANLTPEYAGHRLGEGPVASPFGGFRFRHSGTRIYNVRNSVGAARYASTHHARNLDTFAALIVRNISEGRTTLLVSRKKLKASCARYLAKRLSGWGLDVAFEVERYDQLPVPPSPRVIPVIHYGIRGVNDFTEYESAYCMTSYYVNGKALNDAVQEFESRHFRAQLEIVHGPDRRRRVQVVGMTGSDEDREWLGNVYLRKLEVDPVVQAAGRVRFMTKAREVTFFQMNHLLPDVGECQDVQTLASLRGALGIPAPRDLDDAVEGRRARDLMDSGFTADAAAAELGISRATVFRRLQAVESLKMCKRIYHTLFETPQPPGGIP